MKCLLRAACALLAAALTSLAFSQTQVWSVFQNLLIPARQSSLKMVKAPDGSFYTLGTAGSFSAGLSTLVNRWSSTGQLLWSRQFDAIALDIAANNTYVVITGTSGHQSTGVIASDETRNVLLRYDLNGNASQPVFAGNQSKVALGANGNAFLTITVPDQVTGSRAGYLEYSPSGTLVRTVLYPGSTTSSAKQILVDSQNVTLIGTAGSDRFISQYSLNGQPHWSRFYDLNDIGAGTIADTADSSGAVYILFVFEANSSSGSHVLKYDVSGNLVFDTYIDDLHASHIAVGPSGQVGISSDGFESYQLMPNGDFQWQTPFSDSSTGSSAVVYDSNGFLYFVGHRNVSAGNTNAYLEQVSPTGVIQWQHQDTGFGGFDGLALSSSGPVAFGDTGPTFVEGPSLGLYRTDASGNFLSTTQTQSVIFGHQVAGAAVDANGNTYLVGTPTVITKIDSNGIGQWSQHAGTRLNAVQLSPLGGIVVQDLPLSNKNSVTVRRFSETGVALWQTTLSNLEGPLNLFDDTERQVYPRHTMIEDPAGNTYLIGRKVGQTSHVLVIKLDPDGNVLWTGEWDSQDGSSSYLAEDIAVSPTGLVYAVLVRNNFLNGTNTIVLQLNANTGAINWALPSSQSFDDTEPIAVATNNAGEAFVLGENLMFNPGKAFVWKLDSNANTQWNTIIPGIDRTPAMTDMAIDNGGNIFVTGGSSPEFSAFKGKNFRVVLAKLSPTGSPLFTAFWDDPAGDGTLPQHMTLDASGNAVLGGTTYNDQTGRDLFVLRLSGNTGQPLWPNSGDVFRNGAAIFDAGWNIQDYFAGMGLDTSGNIYVGGNSAGPEGLQDIHVVKYNTTAVQSSTGAQFISQSVPSVMNAGQTYSVSISFKNTGNDPWTKATGFKLGSQNASLNNTWGFGTVSLGNSEVVNPGDTKVFKFTITAPANGGTYNFQWQMRNFSGAFGDKSTNVAVQVDKKAHAARFVAQSMPTVAKAGQHFFVNVVYRNVGTNTWTTAAGYSLMPVPGHESLGVTSVPVPGKVLPNANVSFTFVGVAPTIPGKYTVEWQMHRTSGAFTGFFGDRTIISTITVTP